LDTSTRMAADADLTVDREPVATPPREPLSEIGPLDELRRILDPKPPPFRIQFLGQTPDRGSSVVKEVEIEASDLSAAIIAAANSNWPPQTTGLRILDREGREVFGRQKGRSPTA
jgi:hypothetical protein